MNMYAKDQKFRTSQDFGGKFVYYVYRVYNLRKPYEMLLNYVVVIQIVNECEIIDISLKVWVGEKVMAIVGKQNQLCHIMFLMFVVDVDVVVWVVVDDFEPS